MTQAFFWYELMTSDPAAATDFYAKVVGWRPQSYDASGAYTMLNAGDRGVGGIMANPNKDMPPHWLGYIHSSDVDADTASVKEGGGAIHKAPADIPGVGRFSVVADPTGAVFLFLQPTGTGMPPAPMGTPGHVGWHELYAGDGEAAMEFYAAQFGWKQVDSMDMGPMGQYRLFAFDGVNAMGATMNKPAEVPVPCWQFYFCVDAIDAAHKRITDNGGTIIMGPHEVPGGSWIINAIDPQGAYFAVLGPKD
jgi:predicted enzyme related to lactoylglutathione lyase